MTLSTIEKLLSLQEKDIQIREIQKMLTDIPERKRMEQARLDDLKRAVADADQALKAKQSEIKQLELDVEACKIKMSTLRTQQMKLKTNQEFKAMENEVKALEDQIRKIEDVQLVKMNGLEQCQAELKSRKASLQDEETRVHADLSVWDDRSSKLDQDLKKLEDERAEATKYIDDLEYMRRYQALITRKNVAIVALENGVCGGCHMQLPPYFAHELRKHAGPVTCTFCARLLYLG